MNEKISFDSIINALVQKSNINKTFAHSFVKEMAAVIQQGLLRDNVVNLSGFGIFKLQEVSARLGRNIQTGETITIPAHRKVLFKPEKHLRDLINKNYQHLKATFFNDQADFDSAGIILKDDPSTSLSSNFNGVAEESEKSDSTDTQKDSVANNKGGAGLPGDSNKPDSFTSPEEEDDHLRKTPLIITLIVILTILFIYFQFNGDESSSESSVEEVENVKPVITEKQQENTDQSQIETKKPPAPPPVVQEKKTGQVKTHKAVDGDNLWNLAYKYYNDGYLWPLILHANKDKIKNPDIFKSGINITIPSVTKKDDKLLLAKGHLLAYKEYKKNKEAESINHLYVAYKYDKTFVEKDSVELDRDDLHSVKKLINK